MNPVINNVQMCRFGIEQFVTKAVGLDFARSFQTDLKQKNM